MTVTKINIEHLCYLYFNSELFSQILQKMEKKLKYNISFTKIENPNILKSFLLISHSVLSIIM